MKNAWIWVVVVVIGAVGAIIWYQSSHVSPSVVQTPTDTNLGPTPADNQAPASSTVPSDSGSGSSASSTSAPMSATVSYTESGFAPANVTIKQGGTVTFVNQGGGKMDVASDPHPQHNGYDGTSRNAHCSPGFSGAKPFDQCKASANYSFTFDKVGSWGYHNHLNEADGGVVNVVQ